jgi:hypothetical protein
MEAVKSVNKVNSPKKAAPSPFDLPAACGLGWVVYTPSGYTEVFPTYPLPMGKVGALVRFGDRTVGLFKTDPCGKWGLVHMGDPVPRRAWHRPLKDASLGAAARAEAELLQGELPVDAGAAVVPGLFVSFPADQVPSFERVAGGPLGVAPLEVFKGDPDDSPEETYLHLVEANRFGNKVLLPKAIISPQVRGTRHLYHMMGDLLFTGSTVGGKERGSLSKVQVFLSEDLKGLGFSK